MNKEGLKLIEDKLSRYVKGASLDSSLLDLILMINEQNNVDSLEEKLNLERKLLNTIDKFIESLKDVGYINEVFKFSLLEHKLINISKLYGIDSVLFGFNLEETYLRKIEDNKVLISLSKKSLQNEDDLIISFFHELAHYILLNDEVSKQFSLMTLESFCWDLAFRLARGYGFEFKDINFVNDIIKESLGSYLKNYGNSSIKVETKMKEMS